MRPDAGLAAADTRRLKWRARRALESGYGRAALAALWPAPFLLALAAALGCAGPRLAVLAPLLLVVALGLGWRGGATRRAVAPALIAGAFPLALPLLATTCGTTCGEPRVASACLLACLAGGALGGLTLGIAAARERDASLSFLSSGALVATVAGALGCWVAGVPGLAGLVVGLASGSIPARAVARRLAG